MTVLPLLNQCKHLTSFIISRINHAANLIAALISLWTWLVVGILYEFFIESHDFNGIPLRNISKEFKIDYKESIDIIKKLVIDNSISIQSSTNPHIVGFRHYPFESQLKILEDAKDVNLRSPAS